MQVSKRRPSPAETASQQGSLGAGIAEQSAAWEEGLWRQPGAPGGAVGASASRDRGWRLTSGVLLAYVWSIVSMGQLCSGIVVLLVSEVAVECGTGSLHRLYAEALFDAGILVGLVQESVHLHRWWRGRREILARHEAGSGREGPTHTQTRPLQGGHACFALSSGTRTAFTGRSRMFRTELWN